MSAGSKHEKTYGEDEVKARLRTELPHWTFDAGELQRTYRTHGWKGTLMVVNAVGHLAEAAWHHPDIAASFNSVQVRLKSHDLDAITERDFALAHKIEAFVHWQPAREGGALTGTPKDQRHAYIDYD